MLIQTTRFGEVEIQDQDILTFPSGMLGFSAERHFVMIEDEMGSPFQWLQSIEKQDFLDQAALKNRISNDPILQLLNGTLTPPNKHSAKPTLMGFTHEE